MNLLRIAALPLVLLAGCASPGPPRAPSLKLPQIVTGLTTSRVGDAVTLRWTTPSRTTDKLLIAGPIVAEVCRETPAVDIKASRGAGTKAAKNKVSIPCSPVVLHMGVTPGESQAVDTLPAELKTGAAQLLAYRVQLRNTQGRTAGASEAVYAASGPAPQAVQEFHGKDVKAGVQLEWKAEPQGEATIEVDRTLVASAVAASATSAAEAGSKHKSSLLGTTKEPSEARLRAGGAADVGGTVDRTAVIDHTYRYRAQRVRTVKLCGQMLEVRSTPSAEVTIAVRDVFPPAVPAGLVAVPGLEFSPLMHPMIALSWEPDVEPRVAGYRVYRRDVDSNGTWRRVGPELVSVAEYVDRDVVAGHKYSYRVTAVDTAGNESAPSTEVEETALGE